MRATWEKLGTKPVVMGLGDIYMALSRGQIDGQENGMDAIIGYKWYEVTKYYSPLGQTYEVSVLLHEREDLADADVRRRRTS